MLPPVCDLNKLLMWILCCILLHTLPLMSDCNITGILWMLVHCIVLLLYSVYKLTITHGLLDNAADNLSSYHQFTSNVQVKVCT